jgi:hypothetical protein
MKGIKIGIGNIKTNSSFDMIKLAIRIISITKGLSLSETELHALAHFAINGFTKVSREELINSKLLKNYNAEANLVSRFRKYGIIVKSHLREDLSSDYKIYNPDLEAIKLEMLIKK